MKYFDDYQSLYNEEYDEIATHIDEVYGYCETSDYEFWSDDELGRLEQSIFWKEMI